MKVVLVAKTVNSLSLYRGLTHLNLENSVQHGNPSIAELLGDNVGDLGFHLSFKDEYTRAEVDLQGFSLNNTENVLEKLWNRFHEHLKLSIFIGCKTGFPYPRFFNLVTFEGYSVTHQYGNRSAEVCLCWKLLYEQFRYAKMGSICTTPCGDFCKYRHRDRGFQSSCKQSSQSQGLYFGRKILEECLRSDVTIVAKNGEEIKSHSNFLSACSPVLTAMFKNWTKESQSGQLDMTDVSEEAVRAFLHFIYIGDLEETAVGVAFEVFQMAEKYDIPSLKEEMITNLLGRRNESIKVELAFQIYMFTRNIESAVEIRKKARGILKANFKEVETLPDYEDLFIKSPKVAMEVFGDFMNSS